MCAVLDFEKEKRTLNTWDWNNGTARQLVDYNFPLNLASVCGSYLLELGVLRILANRITLKYRTLASYKMSIKEVVTSGAVGYESYFKLFNSHLINMIDRHSQIVKEDTLCIQFSSTCVYSVSVKSIVRLNNLKNSLSFYKKISTEIWAFHNYFELFTM